MLGKGVPASAEVSFSKVASVYRWERLDTVIPSFSDSRTQFFMSATFNISNFLQFCNTPTRDTGVTEV